MRKINIVIIACILITLFFWLSNPDIILEYLAFSRDNLLKGRVWTVVTSLFLHADILHLAGNMLFLYAFGNTIEEDQGVLKALGAFFIGGIIAFPLSLLFYDGSTPLIGASAAIFTLAAIVMLTKPLKFSILILPQGLIAILYFVYNAVAVYSGAEGNVAYIAHIIGFAIGIPFGLAWSKNWLRNLLITIALLITYLVVAAILIPYILSIIT
ncbi:rhomboid family intramembrane serine protease [Candidatus Bathyarchaeota archaeon A05DMB-2]|nr:rhomboid family intramembrane serine protease [Candidatus Bathyarchaeota archaeon A05DMB-2]